MKRANFPRRAAQKRADADLRQERCRARQSGERLLALALRPGKATKERARLRRAG